MKKIIQSMAVFFFLAAIIPACKKQENKIMYEGGTAPVLTATTNVVRLEAGEEANLAIRFNWSNPDYTLTTGLSSHNVSYVVEIDTVGANFNSSKKLSLGISNSLLFQYTVGELNATLGNVMRLQLNPRRTYNMEAKVSSTVAGNATKLTSNTIPFTVKPFPPPPKVPVPIAGTLWITGDAVASGWNNPLPPPYDLSQKFTKLPSNTDYELIVNMNATGSYKLIQTPGDWSTQYHMATGGTALGGAFEFGDANPAFPAPSVAGSYKLSFNFQLGTFTAVKQ